MENTIGKIAKPEFVKQVSKLEAVTSYLQSVSSNIFSFPSKTFQQNNNVTVLNQEEINSLIVFSKFFWVNWSFSDEKTEKESLCLFIGYKKGFQIWNISDPEKIYEICSVYENIDEIKAIEIIPSNSQNSLLNSECPFLALLNVKTIEVEDEITTTYKKSEIIIYSLEKYEIVKTITFDDNVEILKFKANKLALVVSLSSNELHIISLFDFSTAAILTDVAPSQYDNHPAIFDLGCRYLAYATTTSPDTLDKNNKIQMSVVAEKVAKEVISGVKVLGNIGLQAVKAAKNSYYQNSSNNETNNILINDESNNTKNEINYQFPVGMIKIFDIKKILQSKDLSNVIPLAHFQAQHHYMEYVQFNESGSLLVTSSCEGFTLNIWKLENHFDKKSKPLTCLYKLKRGKTSARIESVSFSMDSRWVCVLSNHGTAHLYYIDPFGVEEMYKRNEVMKLYNDIPISNVNSSNFKNIRSKSINEMVNTNLITTPAPKIPSPLQSPSNESSPNSSNNKLSSPSEGVMTTTNEYSTSASLNINTIKQGNYHTTIAHSYHSNTSMNDNNEFGNLSSSVKSNSYSSSYRNSYMNYVNPNHNNGSNSNASGKPTQSYALCRIKFKKCSLYYIDSNQASYALAMNMNHKIGPDSMISTSSAPAMNISDSSTYASSTASVEGNEVIHPTFYSPASCGKFLNKVLLSNDKREHNEKQKILIFRVTDDHRQGQLELYKFYGNETDDSSPTLETSPTTNLNNSISPRKKSFSFSPSNSISLTNICNSGDDILNSKIKVQKTIHWDLHRKKNWPQVKSAIKTIVEKEKKITPKPTSSIPYTSTSSVSSSSKIVNNTKVEVEKPNVRDTTINSTSQSSTSSLSASLQNVSLRSSSSLNKFNNGSTSGSSLNKVNNGSASLSTGLINANTNLNSTSLTKESNNSQSGRRRSKGYNNKNRKSSLESSSPPQDTVASTASMSSLQSQLLNNKKLMKEKAKQNQYQNQNQNSNNIDSVPTPVPTPIPAPASSTITPSINTSYSTNSQVKPQETKVNNSTPTKISNSTPQDLLSPESLKQLSKKNKKWMENIEINPYDIYHMGPPIWLYSQFVLQVFVNEEEGSTQAPDEKDNVDLYGNPVYNSYSKNQPDYEGFPRTKSISVFKRKPKPSSDYGIIPIVNADSDLLQESLFNAINNDGIDYDNFELQKSCSELMKQELSFDDALHIYSTTSVVTTKDISNNNGESMDGQITMAIEDDATTQDPEKENYNFKKVESVTLSSVKTKTISYDEDGNEFEELSDEDEHRNHVFGLESNPNDDLQLIEENVIQEEDREDQDKVIVSKRSQQFNGHNPNSYVSKTTTITHLYISPDPPEAVLKKS